MAQCKYKRYVWGRCEEPAQAGQSLCILHDKAPARNASEFLWTLKDKVEREERDGATTEVNLAGVVFPPGFRWADVVSSDRALGKSANFVDAKFNGAASFLEAKFNGVADFRGATFSEAAIFLRATFNGTAKFLGATFSGAANFGDATFSGDADFLGATFQNWLTFQETTFPQDEGPGVVRFTNVTLERPDRVYFEGVDLSRVSFLGTDIRQVHFLNTTWAKLPKRPRPLPKGWPFSWIGPL